MEAQVSTAFFQEKDAFKTFPALKSVSKVVPVKRMAAVNVEKLLAEDRELEGLDVPFRFGYGFDVSYTLEDGIWEKSSDVNIWSLKVASPGAYSLNFIFDRLSLAGGAELYIYSADGTMVYGPVTASENLPEVKKPAVKASLQPEESERLFLTDLVAGDEAVIRLIERTDVQERSVLHISRVVHGYVNTFKELGIQTRAQSGNCNIDVACYPGWTDESDAVALVMLASGTEWCSGALLNNTHQDFKAYFLSAYHCLDVNQDDIVSSSEKTTANVQNWTFRFGYKKLTCNGSTVAYMTVAIQPDSFRYH
jgi:hypothetical protein